MSFKVFVATVKKPEDIQFTLERKPSKIHILEAGTSQFLAFQLQMITVYVYF